MSKILEATCEDGVVTDTAENIEVPEATILSEGVAPSEGVLILQNGSKWYLCSNATDIKDLLEQIVTALTNISSALSTIDAKPVGGSGSAPAPAVASNVSAITSAKNTLDTLKDNLK